MLCANVQGRAAPLGDRSHRCGGARLVLANVGQHRQQRAPDLHEVLGPTLGRRAARLANGDCLPLRRRSIPYKPRDAALLQEARTTGHVHRALLLYELPNRTPLRRPQVRRAQPYAPACWQKVSRLRHILIPVGPFLQLLTSCSPGCRRSRRPPSSGTGTSARSSCTSTCTTPRSECTPKDQHTDMEPATAPDGGRRRTLQRQRRRYTALKERTGALHATLRTQMEEMENNVCFYDFLFITIITSFKHFLTSLKLYLLHFSTRF